MIQKKFTLRNGAMLSVVAIAVGMSACSSNSSSDNDNNVTETPTAPTTPDNTDNPAATVTTVDLTLDSTSTVPPANVDGAAGTGSFTVDTTTGAISGSVTVSGTSGVPTAAHIHRGAAGEAGGVALGLTASEDSNTWTVPEGSALDAADIALFQAGNLYVNVHTEANPNGELRSQLVSADAPTAGSYTITFTNNSDSQPMTPPLVALHNAPTADNGIRLFEVTQPAIPQVIEIAENGNFGPLNDVVAGQITAGTISAGGPAFPDPANPGPLTPGSSASITLTPSDDSQVLSFVSMVVCTNDGFSGVDSRPLAEETFTAPIYDAGSETNVLTLDYWVPPCGNPDSPNLGDDEGGAITLHPGQSGSENPAFDFESGTELLEVSITRN